MSSASRDAGTMKRPSIHACGRAGLRRTPQLHPSSQVRRREKPGVVHERTECGADGRRECGRGAHRSHHSTQPPHPFTRGGRPSALQGSAYLRDYLQPARSATPGRPELRFDGTGLAHVTPPRVFSLLAFLIVNRDRRLTRAAAASSLWIDESEDDARSNLRRHLSVLNAGLPKIGIPWIVATTTTLQWNQDAPAWVDIVDFERLVQDPDSADAAAALYRGDFLQGHFEDWMVAERERFQNAFLDIAYGLAVRARSNRDFAKAGEYADRVLALGEWREDALRLKMAAAYEMGDRPGALAAFDRFVKTLSADVGVDVMPETRALREAIVANVALGAEPAVRTERSAAADRRPRRRARPFAGYLATRGPSRRDDRFRWRRGRYRQDATARRVFASRRNARRPRARRARARGRRRAVPAARRHRARGRTVPRPRGTRRRLALCTRLRSSRSYCGSIRICPPSRASKMENCVCTKRLRAYSNRSPGAAPWP